MVLPSPHLVPPGSRQWCRPPLTWSPLDPDGGDSRDGDVGGAAVGVQARQGDLGGARGNNLGIAVVAADKDPVGTGGTGGGEVWEEREEREGRIQQEIWDLLTCALLVRASAEERKSTHHAQVPPLSLFSGPPI